MLSFITSFAAYIPERITHVSRLAEQIHAPYESVEKMNIHHAVVMIEPFANKGWVFGKRNPSPELDDDVIYCWYADSTSNIQLIRRFQDRTPFILHFDPVMDKFLVIPADTGTGRPVSFE